MFQLFPFAIGLATGAVVLRLLKRNQHQAGPADPVSPAPPLAAAQPPGPAARKRTAPRKPRGSAAI